MLPDDTRPPSRDIRIGRKGMANPYHITPIRIQPPISMIGNSDPRQYPARFQLKRLIQS